MDGHEKETHPKAIGIIDQLATALYRQGRLDETDIMLSNVLSRETGPESLSTAKIANNLAELYDERYHCVSGEDERRG